MKYLVQIPEVWIRTVEIEAGSAQDTIERALAADADTDVNDITFEYSHIVKNGCDAQLVEPH